ncbi:MAG: hypothetical protein FJ041_02935, partial [Candidatus Cloacimonetes bacterium]|nr:hypothetical protein [Candidatus Cloacimonadota bacterium]
MKKPAIILVLILFVSLVTLYGAIARSYNQVLGYANGNITSVITNSSTEPSAPGYYASAHITTRPNELTSTATHNNTQIRIYRTGTAPNYYVMLFLQFGSFTTNWAVGDTIKFTVTLTATGETLIWYYYIATSSGTITIQNPVQ